MSYTKNTKLLAGVRQFGRLYIYLKINFRYHDIFRTLRSKDLKFSWENLIQNHAPKSKFFQTILFDIIFRFSFLSKPTETKFDSEFGTSVFHWLSD